MLLQRTTRRVVPMMIWRRGLATSERASQMASFKVMEVLKAANAMETAGREVFHLEVGQPQTGAPPSAVKAAQDALAAGLPMGYTAAMGMDSLRARIARWYTETGQGHVDPERILVTTGSSAGFVLGFSALFEPGDHVGVPSVAYPCYRNVLRALGCVAVPIGGDKDDPMGGFALPDAASLKEHGNLKGLVLSSPSNPTGATLCRPQLEALAKECDRQSIAFVSDEIYHHIHYDENDAPASAVQTPNALVVNSFSKFFSMTGWRVGWLVLPKEAEQSLVNGLDRLQQNMFINAPTISQIAAEAAFDDAQTSLALNVESYARNRETVLGTLSDIGFDKHMAEPKGAFYAYCDVRHLGIKDTPDWCSRLLNDTGVALTPGVDFEFDEEVGKTRLRVSYCGANDKVKEAMRRLKAWHRGEAAASSSSR